MKRILKALYLFLCIIAILLTLLLFNNKSYSFKHYNFFNKAFGYLLITNKATTVSSSNKFLCIDNNKYTNNEKKVYPLSNGTIVRATSDTIILKTVNGYIVKYTNIINVSARIYDYVTKEDALASFIDYFECSINKGNFFYTYEEYIKNN
ncbi:MAG: hypothetical protein SOU19_08425 [Candidatus Caccosoma sp.]|nr:hypothetical protein [Candidatus Caccosoma sp.]